MSDNTKFAKSIDVLGAAFNQLWEICPIEEIQEYFADTVRELSSVKEENKHLKELLNEGIDVLGHGHFNVEGYKIQKDWWTKVREVVPNDTN